MTLKMAVVAPMPSASVKSDTSRNVGWRTRARAAYLNAEIQSAMPAF